MVYYGILYETAEDNPPRETPEAPACFGDLNLDQVVHAITAKKQEYNLKPLYYTPIQDEDAIRYRQEIMRDLDGVLLANIEAFAQKMSTMRRYLGLVAKLRYRYHREGWFLEAVATYCDAVQCLVEDLAAAPLASRGMVAFRAYLNDYAHSAPFQSLTAQTSALKRELAEVRYCIIIRGLRVQVCKYEDESDYSIDVEETFARFRQGAGKDYSSHLAESTGMSHVGAHILELVAKLYPDVFKALLIYCEQHAAFADPTIQAFDREIQFYAAYLQHIAGFREAGLTFCYPLVSQETKEVYIEEAFDMALAIKCLSDDLPIVCNDIHLAGQERLLIVSGPNQGGKTTFARMFGQLHYLASLGLPVPGRRAQLYLCDALLTHFEREEDIRTLRGRLQDELVRMQAILQQATSHSIIIINEIFASTTAEDAAFLARETLQRILALDVLGVCVTFIDELATFSEQTVSMVSTVAPTDPTRRTFKIIRRPADGKAYTRALIDKYRLTYEYILNRIDA
jgi:hypothetical protein